MNKELSEILKMYSIGTHEALNSYLVSKSKDTIIGILVDLITMYINDKNSSTVREFITVTLAGYEHREAKIGYNGFKHDTFAQGRTQKCEAKPKNFDTEEYNKYLNGERKTSPAKLNGSGNFTDYTMARFTKDRNEKDLRILASGFIDGRLIYILEFPFAYADFTRNLEAQLNRWQSKLKGSASTTGQFLRGATFNYKNFADSPDLKVIYILSEEELSRYSKYISRDFYNYLRGKAKNAAS